MRNLRDEYLSATSVGKKFMEQRFGKRVIQKAVEESFSRDWLNENCKGCPRCGTNIQVWRPPLATALMTGFDFTSPFTSGKGPWVKHSRGESGL